MRPVRLALVSHFIIGAAVLIASVPSVTALLVGRVLGDPVIPSFFVWSRFFHFPEKREDLVAFVAVSSLLFVYAAAWARMHAWLERTQWIALAGSRRPAEVLAPFLWSWFVQITCVVLLRDTLEKSLAAVVAYSVGFAVTVAAPLVPASAWWSDHAPGRDRLESAVHRWTSVAMVASCLALVAWMFGPLLTGNVRLLNDQITAPEQTVLSTGTVTNLDFIREHAIYGLHIGTAETKPEDTAERRATYEMPARMTPLLRDWLGEERGAIFDARRSHLTVLGAMEDIEVFQRLELALGSEQEAQDLRRLNALVNQERQYTAVENEFIDKNWLELRWQMLNRWAIHHHNFVFGPMNELELGKPSSSISFQYGYVNAILLTGLTKLLGGFTLENYFRATWLFYPLYLVLLLAISQTVLRDRRYTALVGLIAVASMLSMDYEKIIRAPGVSPLRHVLDIPVIGLAVWYWRRAYRPALAGAYALAVLQIALNRDFGLVLVGALVGVEILHACRTGVRARQFEMACAGAGLLGAAVVLAAIGSIPNYMAKYFAAGFASPPLPISEVAIPMLLFAGLYGMSLWPGRIDAGARRPVLLLTLYCNGIYLYYVWGASSPHFQNLEPVYGLLGVVALQAALSHPALRSAERRLPTAAQVAAAVVLVVPAWLEYRDIKADFDEVFRTHVVHTWTFPRAHVESTIDPRPFEEAVALIDQYEPVSKGVYFISVFDNLLPILANRYSAMPFFDLQWFLLTDDEFRLAKERILGERPRYLFVDHDILFDHAGEVADARLRRDSEATHVESILRIRRLQVLQDLFREVSGGYVRVAQSPLIDVYERRPL